MATIGLEVSGDEAARFVLNAVRSDQGLCARVLDALQLAETATRKNADSEMPRNERGLLGYTLRNRTIREIVPDDNWRIEYKGNQLRIARELEDHALYICVAVMRGTLHETYAEVYKKGSTTGQTLIRQGLPDLQPGLGFEEYPTRDYAGHFLILILEDPSAEDGAPPNALYKVSLVYPKAISIDGTIIDFNESELLGYAELEVSETPVETHQIVDIEPVVTPIEHEPESSDSDLGKS